MKQTATLPTASSTYATQSSATLTQISSTEMKQNQESFRRWETGSINVEILMRSKHLQKNGGSTTGRLCRNGQRYRRRRTSLGVSSTMTICLLEAIQCPCSLRVILCTCYVTNLYGQGEQKKTDQGCICDSNFRAGVMDVSLTAWYVISIPSP